MTKINHNGIEIEYDENRVVLDNYSDLRQAGEVKPAFFVIGKDHEENEYKIVWLLKEDSEEDEAEDWDNPYSVRKW